MLNFNYNYKAVLCTVSDYTPLKSVIIHLIVLFIFSIVLFETRITKIMYSSGSLQGAMMFSSYVLVYY